jgi:lysophospholipid acyltransferase (LPLAT)-like uncharacterized protein
MGPYGLKLRLAPPAWRVLSAGMRLRAEGDVPPPGALIFACLHRDILPALVHVRPWRPHLLVSNSPDGEILVRCLGERHYQFVRGATGLDGGRAFVRLRRVLEAGGAVGLAVDGPLGPYGQVRDGVLQLARLTGAPIVPLMVRAPRSLVLRTWDRTVVPLPLSTVTVRQGRPLRVAPDDSDRDAVRAALLEFLEPEGAPA